MENNEAVLLTLNTDAYEYNKKANWYVVDNEVTFLSGSLSNKSQVKDLIYKVLDVNGKTVKYGNITIDEEWSVGDFGLTVGYNNVIITATLKSGKAIEKSIEIINFNTVNMNRISVDMGDDDSDGLCNYYEEILGTDKDKVDTDGDGINDYDELLKTGTDPVLKDTDNNGITDNKEDYDGDGLDNISEIEYGTNCYLQDTDGDGISDGDELLIYQTNPLVMDTDGDGLNDGEEIQLHFDPTNSDTDADGILDGKEIQFQTYSIDLHSAKKTGITNISVSLECEGYIDDRVTVIDTYDLDMRSSDVVGLVGVPIEITSDVDFETANIVFTYDENALGETSEDNLSMMWYDKANDIYVLLEDSIVDKENNTVTYTTTHFSTYLVVDEKKWMAEMSECIEKYNDIIAQYGKNKVLQDTGTIYKCFEDGMTWDEARIYCEKIGAFLLSNK